MKTSEICDDKTERRRAIREHRGPDGNPDVNGIDYIEADDADQQILHVHFLDKAPENITEKNVRINGGQRIRNIQVKAVELCEPDDPEQADCMLVTVDKAGDFSVYTLCLVQVDASNQPTDMPLQGFDPRYTCIDFSFKANCPSDLDCKQEDTCTPEVLDEPEINYLAKDYASFRQLILDRLALIMPDWQERHLPDIGITLVEILAYVGDYLSYYQDAVATEAYLKTARQRISIRRHVRLVDYAMHEGCNSRAWLFVETDTDLSLDPQDIYFITGYNDALGVGITMLSDDDVQRLPSSDFEIFEPLLINPGQPIQLYEAHNKIPFYSWGDKQCCLPRGATTATLKDEWIATSPPPSPDVTEELPRTLHLQVGDVLIFEEVVGPRTGVKEDANASHRQVVRLTRVEPGVDTLYNIPVVEIEWGVEDALPFPLCLSAIGPAQVPPGSPPDSVVLYECQLLEDISIARGNVILVDYGKTIRDEDLGSVPSESTTPTCEGEGDLADIQTSAGVFRPTLQQAPLTFYETLELDAPFFRPPIPDPHQPVSLTSAQKLLLQDPRHAVPWIKLTGTLPANGATLHGPARGGNYVTAEGNNAGAGGGRTDQGAEDNNIVWLVQYDLLESTSDDYHFVVEMDNDGFAHLRFGDGELGRMPEAGTQFKATYRIGNGPTGNVGAETISHIVFRNTLFAGANLQPRNPFAASGGVASEPLDEVKLFAPHAFRSSKNLQRAITADDYARLAERNAKVQRAAAALRWTGSWFEVLVAIDPRGSEEVDQALLNEITAYLEIYRRMGHDLKVVPAHYVELDIAMTICVQPDFQRGHVKAALLDAFSNRILPTGQPGFFHPDNLTFGQGIALSKLVAIAQAIQGVQSVEVTRLRRLSEGPHGELSKEFLPIGPMEIAQLDNDPSFPEHGKIEFKMVGGR
jgi:hypothetical protein